jgi:LDH2 family malate/lactate/ureidoglycolate dehydrogenase
MDIPQTITCKPDDVISFATTLLTKAGLPSEKAEVVAQVLVDGELANRSTHGLALLVPYLQEIETGGMSVEGGPEVISDFGACLTWDGRKLPGPWLVQRALDEAIDRASKFGMGTVAIQRAHHTASLGSYLKSATDRGYIAFITLTDPSHSSVAPFGGTKPVLTSNPFAFGAPTDTIPIIVDVATSMVTNGNAAKMYREGQKFETDSLLDARGTPTNDPTVLFAEPAGSILPLGGAEAGHKGYGLGMMIEVLSGCLTGYGRAAGARGWSAAVFVLAIDPGAFGGRDAYFAQVKSLVDACHRSPPRAGFDRVRLPGEASGESRARQMQSGMTIGAEILRALQPWSEKFKVPPIWTIN